MKLATIFSLIGQNVQGLTVDLRRRDGKGNLVAPEIEKRPKMATLETVEIRKKNGAKWLYWTYDGHGCGYSGMTFSHPELKTRSIFIQE